MKSFVKLTHDQQRGGKRGRERGKGEENKEEKRGKRRREEERIHYTTTLYLHIKIFKKMTII